MDPLTFWMEYLEGCRKSATLFWAIIFAFNMSQQSERHKKRKGRAFAPGRFIIMSGETR